MRAHSEMKTIAIVYRFLPQYRVEFYEKLRAMLATEGIDLRLIYGDGDAKDREKGDLVDLDWGIKVENRIWPVGSRKIYWQPVFKHLEGAELIIVEQASRLLINYLLLARQQMGGPKIAFWGHGKNFQATDENRLAEWLKQRYSRFPHWWFAYNHRSARVLDEFGYPPEQITIVENAIDTSRLRQWMDSVSEDEKADIRIKLGLQGNNLGIFVGGLYPEKRLRFLVGAAEKVREVIKDFELLIVGDGVDRSVAEQAAERHSWVHYRGPVFGREKAVYLSISRVFLMPGLVGLAVLDAFTAGLPLVTTDIDFHSPEIDYLRHNENGVLSLDDARAYSDEVIRVINDDGLYARLRSGAIEGSRRYTIGNMVERFGGGIKAALSV